MIILEIQFIVPIISKLDGTIKGFLEYGKIVSDGYAIEQIGEYLN